MTATYDPRFFKAQAMAYTEFKKNPKTASATFDGDPVLVFFNDKGNPLFGGAFDSLEDATFAIMQWDVDRMYGKPDPD